MKITQKPTKSYGALNDTVGAVYVSGTLSYLQLWVTFILLEREFFLASSA